MSCRYSTIWMGPINPLWTQKNGEHWAAGRIDIRGSHEDEISLPMMLAEDWNRLSIWLSAYTTKSPVKLDKLLEDYYNDGYKQITWWKE